ncbi:hypothetical protein Tco_0848779 [Tanacetum coccineum]
MVMATNINTPENQRLCALIRSMTDNHLDKERLKLKKVNQYFEAKNLPRSEVIELLIFELFKIALSLSFFSLSLGLGLYLCYRLVPSCCVIIDLETLSLSFDLVFSSKIFKSFSFRSLSSMPSCDLVSWYQHDHIVHHLLKFADNLYLDNLDISKEDLEYQSCESLCLILSFLDS